MKLYNQHYLSSVTGTSNLLHLQISKQFLCPSILPLYHNSSQYFLSTVIFCCCFYREHSTLDHLNNYLPLSSFYRKSPWKHQFSESLILNLLFPFSWTHSNQTIIPTNRLVINKISSDVTLLSPPLINSSWLSTLPTIPWHTSLFGFSSPYFSSLWPFGYSFLVLFFPHFPGLYMFPRAQSLVLFFICIYIYSLVNLRALNTAWGRWCPHFISSPNLTNELQICIADSSRHVNGKAQKQTPGLPLNHLLTTLFFSCLPHLR